MSSVRIKTMFGFSAAANADEDIKRDAAIALSFKKEIFIWLRHQKAPTRRKMEQVFVHQTSRAATDYGAMALRFKFMMSTKLFPSVRD